MTTVKIRQKPLVKVYWDKLVVLSFKKIKNKKIDITFWWYFTSYPRGLFCSKLPGGNPWALCSGPSWSLVLICTIKGVCFWVRTIVHIRDSSASGENDASYDYVYLNVWMVRWPVVMWVVQPRPAASILAESLAGWARRGFSPVLVAELLCPSSEYWYGYWRGSSDPGKY